MYPKVTLLTIAVLLALSQHTLTGVPFIPELEQDYQSDKDFCSNTHSDLNTLPVDTDSDSQKEILTVTRPSTKESLNLKFIIKQDLDTYFKKNLTDTAIWVVFFFICFFSFLGCSFFLCYKGW